MLAAEHSLPASQPFAQAPVDLVARNSEVCGPVCDAAGLTVDGDEDEVPVVSALHIVRSPSAVFGGVRPIVVDSVDGVFGARPAPHVGEEVLETVAPPVAHLDPPASVIVETFPVFIQAPTAKSFPDSVLGSAALSMGLVGHGGPDSLETSAALSVPVPQGTSTNDFHSAALASATPHALPVLVDADVLDNLKFPELLAEQVLSSHEAQSTPTKVGVK